LAKATISLARFAGLALNSIFWPSPSAQMILKLSLPVIPYVLSLGFLGIPLFLSSMRVKNLWNISRNDIELKRFFVLFGFNSPDIFSDPGGPTEIWLHDLNNDPMYHMVVDLYILFLLNLISIIINGGKRKECG
jgi:hypothetical protein